MKTLFFLFFFIQTVLFSVPHLVLIGAAGAGKGTLTQALKELYPYDSKCIGDILRQEVLHKTEIGIIIENKINQGELIDNKILFPLLEQHLKKAFSSGVPIILDGAIQSLDNIIFIENLLNSIKTNDEIYYLYLKIDYETAYNRLTSRYVCNSCGYTSSRENIHSDKCPTCQIQLVQRMDDSQDVFIKRLDRFYDKVEPLLTFYKNKNNFFVIDAKKSREEILNQTLNLIAKK